MKKLMFTPRSFLRRAVPSAALLGLLSLSGAVMAQVQVQEPWVRATVAGQKATGAFMKLHSPQPTRLVEARSPVAGVVEIHEMAMDGGVMKMRAIPGLPITAGQTVELKPGGYHVMLMDLKGQVKPGDEVPLTLVFEGGDGKKQTLELKAPARPLNTAMGGDGKGHGAGHGGTQGGTHGGTHR